MKTIRLLVLVLLALLLPLRGAVAEVLLCAGHAAAVSHGEHAVTAVAQHDCEPAVADHADGAHEAEEAAADPHGASGAAAKCNTCSASCSMSPLLGAMPVVPAPGWAPESHASSLDAPAPSHLTDGQERPPRSI
ncbi:hypothetical protein [Rubrivivax gelatinosus]|uniref:Uncharacterized protein n=1 Tax=Rubrivivax gelatinosus TaxID=28068 RepID=A0A4R2M9B8_RUBGE|nr:hypothetical protein [Rubrivivax gelatinosus]MBK1687616.1 hypothetical protein [Rubrivivax gelatinosus]TCP02990.1 hypothetical protein EV684_105156 [Rubrivivax gelatinosus]